MQQEGYNSYLSWWSVNHPSWWHVYDKRLHNDLCMIKDYIMTNVDHDDDLGGLYLEDCLYDINIMTCPTSNDLHDDSTWWQTSNNVERDKVMKKEIKKMMMSLHLIRKGHNNYDLMKTRTWQGQYY